MNRLKMFFKSERLLIAGTALLLTFFVQTAMATAAPSEWDFWGWGHTLRKPLGVGDVDGDFFDEIITVSRRGRIKGCDIDFGSIHRDITLGNPHKKWNWALTSRQTWDKPLGVGDINGDGYDDIIIINGDGGIHGIIVEDGKISSPVYMGNPHADWGWTLTSKQTWDKPLGVGDINGDGYDDILIINGCGDIHGIIVEDGSISGAEYLGNPRTKWGWTLTSQQSWDKPLGVGDINGDWEDDIVIINGDGSIHGIIIENGSISWAEYLGNPHADWGWAITSQQKLDRPLGVGDVDGDGDDDIIIINGKGYIHGIIVEDGDITKAVFLASHHRWPMF